MNGGCSSVVEHLLMVWWVVGSIPHGVSIELLFDSTSAPSLCSRAVVCAILSEGWCI